MTSTPVRVGVTLISFHKARSPSPSQPWSGVESESSHLPANCPKRVKLCINIMHWVLRRRAKRKGWYWERNLRDLPEETAQTPDSRSAGISMQLPRQVTGPLLQTPCSLTELHWRWEGRKAKEGGRRDWGREGGQSGMGKPLHRDRERPREAQPGLPGETALRYFLSLQLRGDGSKPNAFWFTHTSTHTHTELLFRPIFSHAETKG